MRFRKRRTSRQAPKRSREEKEEQKRLAEALRGFDPFAEPTDTEREWWREQEAACAREGHRWSDFGDEDAEGWFLDVGGGADCLTRSCTRCMHAEHRDLGPSDESELEPNRSARSIGKRPAMQTNFGDDLDEESLDTLGGREGEDVDAAMRRYETFHAKAPIRVTELNHDLPTSWVCVGDGLAVMYRTDKWKKDGTDEDYKHLHDAGDDRPYEVQQGVRFYEPATRGQRGERLPAPKAITLLGYCLGAFIRKDEDGQQYETNPRGCYLFAAPDGHTLYLYSPDKQPDGSSGFLAAMHGGKLRVLKDGIDG